MYTATGSDCDAPSIDQGNMVTGPRFCCCSPTPQTAVRDCPIRIQQCSDYGTDQDACRKRGGCSFLPAWRMDRNRLIARLRSRLRRVRGNRAARRRVKNRMRAVNRVYAACQGNSGCQPRGSCGNVCRPICEKLNHCEWKTSGKQGCQKVEDFVDIQETNSIVGDVKEGQNYVEFQGVKFPWKK